MITKSVRFTVNFTCFSQEFRIQILYLILIFFSSSTLLILFCSSARGTYVRAVVCSLVVYVRLAVSEPKCLYDDDDDDWQWECVFVCACMNAESDSERESSKQKYCLHFFPFIHIVDLKSFFLGNKFAKVLKEETKKKEQNNSLSP